MSSHQSSAVSVAVLITAVGVITIGYRAGRTHAALRDLRAAKRDVPAKRKVFWNNARPLIVGTAVLMLTLFAAAYAAGT